MENPPKDSTPCLENDPSARIDTITLGTSHVNSSDIEAARGLGGCLVPSEGTATWIHILPHELVLLIFQLYAGMHTPVRNLVALTLVCKLWQHIVEGTPSLWCWISGEEALPRVRKALAMAKDAPLEIHYPEEGAKTDQETFFTEIYGRITHWRSLVVGTGNADTVVALLKSAVAPNLETLHLCGPYGWKGGPVTLFGGEQAPHALTDFKVHYIPVVMEPLRLSGLRSLELRELPIMSAEELLRVLSVSPALEHYCLQNLACLTDFTLPGHKKEFSTLHGVETRTIHLSHLRSLTLGGLPVSFVHLVLSIIRAPVLQGCFLDCRIDRHDQSPTSDLLTTHISHLIPVLAALTNEAEEIEINSFGDNDWTFTVGKFAIGTEGASALQRKHLDEMLEWLFGYLGGHLKALPVSLIFFELDVDSEWFTWVVSTLKVTKLELWTGPFRNRDPDQRPRNIISLLSQPLVSAPIKWLFPELESIDTNVVHEYGKSKILEMVKARHSYIETQGKDAGDSILKPFREIRLRGGRNNISKEVVPHAEFLDALQEAAKGAEIWWEEVKWTGNKDSGSK
ncbi:hypothetical protein M407DRAFT_227395 [Tulasnella calospora MUT 4182]|uniref:F-box domain-containing protein n=1 Tax=Tulasnella calospora MUT 4182 TaxID=1051891 RepID=A0A0C3QEI4_9AGAM|nr:hypothetical protein M407DRAFT_227395 [Tulasnella calospora MUT 4182]